MKLASQSILLDYTEVANVSSEYDTNETDNEVAIEGEAIHHKPHPEHNNDGNVSSEDDKNEKTDDEEAIEGEAAHHIQGVITMAKPAPYCHQLIMVPQEPIKPGHADIHE